MASNPQPPKSAQPAAAKPKAATAGAKPAASLRAEHRARLMQAFLPLSDRLLGVSTKESEVYGYFNSTDSEELLAKYAPFTASSPLLRLGKEAARTLESLATDDRTRLIAAFTAILAEPRGADSRPLAETTESYRLMPVGPYRIVFWYDRPFDAVRIALIDRRSDDPVTHAIDAYLAS